jgi:excisionase family DNA binding protein
MTTLDDISKRLERLETLVTFTSKAVLNVNEVAMLTGYKVKYLRLLISRREIPHYRRGNRIYFNRAEVEEWMMGERIPTAAEVQNLSMQYKAGHLN